MAAIEHLWGIILAGGEGKRLQEFIRKRYDSERPKQYAAIVGKRCMLRHTLDRVEKIIPPKRLQIVAARKHRKYLPEVLKEREIKSVVFAPENRESAASIYLALSHIAVRDQDAIVAIFPSDHFIGEEDRFMRYVELGISFCGDHPDYVVLLGVKPSEANPEYGWIEPSKKFLLHKGSRFYKVQRFSEKPSSENARQYLNQGWLWNSLVVVATCGTLVKIFRQRLECVYNAFKNAETRYGTDSEDDFIASAFAEIPTFNFSKSVLEEIPESLFVLRLDGIHWSDWGNKEQVLKDLDLLGMVTIGVNK